MLCGSDLDKSEWQHLKILVLVVLYEYRVLMFTVKTFTLVFIGCTWQWASLWKALFAPWYKTYYISLSYDRAGGWCTVPFLVASFFKNVFFLYLVVV
jgi:hypothetical protein